MNKRREVLRVAGWIAVLGGLLSVIGAAVTDTVVLDYMAAYGILFLGAGSWAIAGLAVLNRYERRVAARHVAVRAVPNRQPS
jgi:hypothetical protein